MKKSVAIRALEYRLSEIAYIEDVNEKVFEDEEVAEMLLNYMLGLGMLPPAIQSDIYSRADCDFYMENEWEPEDGG